jgi:hypothetical protein
MGFGAALLCTQGVSNLCAADAYVATIFAVQGKPRVLNESGKFTPIALMQELPHGSNLILGNKDRVKICYEKTGIVYSVEGPGIIKLAETNPLTEETSPRPVEIGRCEATGAPDIAGGVLMRSPDPDEGRRSR